MGKLTLKAAKAEVKALGGTLRWQPEWNEYRVKFGEAEYFTNDREDAVGTARQIAATLEAANQK